MAGCGGGAETFAAAWSTNDQEFARIRVQYERIFSTVPEDRMKKWKVGVGLISEEEIVDTKRPNDELDSKI